MISESRQTEALSAPYVLEYAYKRSLGPVLSEFFTGLREGRIVGIRAMDGRVLVPPQEYDPLSGESLHETVIVKDTGTVTSWSWVAEPRGKHPLDEPFAWALVRLDGADTSMLHVVDAGEIDMMQTGMRVKAKWAQDRVGFVSDIVSFVPVED